MCGCKESLFNPPAQAGNLKWKNIFSVTIIFHLLWVLKLCKLRMCRKEQKHMKFSSKIFVNTLKAAESYTHTHTHTHTHM